MKHIKTETAEKELTGDRITVGLATCGISAGGVPVFDSLKADSAGLAAKGFSIFKVGCIGMCYNEPLVTVIRKGKKSVYGNVTKENVETLIDCIKKDKICKELLVCHELEELDFYKKQKRILMENCGTINPLRLDHYLAMDGYAGLTNALKLKPADVVEEVKKSGLRGRGGAGFSTGIKWSFILGKKGKKYLICNGDEGDPGAFMNRTVMESDPFKIIEGMTIGAYATGADEGIIYTRAEYPLAIETLEKAIKIAYKEKLLGKNILGKGFNFDLSIRKGAGAFVCGEETALLNSIEGKRGSPKPRPPYPAVKGLYGKPTIINNVGTWSHVSTLMKIGADTYSKIGSEKTRGTKVVCLTGKIKRAGIIEVPIGMSLKEIVYDIGGGTPTGKLKGVLTGGPAGGCIPAEKLNTKLDYETLQALGAIMGSGGIVVIDDSACMVNVAHYFMKFTQEESCGKCTPCREGTKKLLDMLKRVSQGKSSMEEFEKIKTLSHFVKENSLCGLGQNAPNPILSTIQFFEKEYIAHIKDKKCPSAQCKELLGYFITEKCVGCGTCKRNCPVGAISGDPKKRHVIDQNKCIKCGKCYEVCPFDAIIRK